MNFFIDNQDLQFIFHNTDLSDIMRMWEKDFSGKDQSDYAPADIDDALDHYRRVLEVAGDIAARSTGEVSLIASDILAHLPAAFQSIRDQS